MEKFGQMVQSADSPHILVGVLGEADKTSWTSSLMLGASRLDEFRAFSKEIRGQGSESAYQVCLGLARLDGEKELFEDLAVEYAVNLGVNPPGWLDQHSKSTKTESDDHEIRVTSLTFDLTIETTIKMESPWPVRIDMAGTIDFEESGLELFNDSITSRRDRKLKTKVYNGDEIAGLILANATQYPIEKCKFGWDFILTYFMISGNKTKFDAAMAIYESKGGKVIAFHDLSERDESPSEKKITSRGILVGEKLANLNADFAKKCLKSPQGERVLASDKKFIFDFTFVKSGSLVDILPLSGFISEMRAANTFVSFINVNEIIFATLSAFGLGFYGVEISLAGSV